MQILYVSYKQHIFQLHKGWFSPADVSSKRTHIRELLYEISGDNIVSASGERDSSESAGVDVDERFDVKDCVHETWNSANACCASYYNCTTDEEFNSTPVAEKPVSWYGEANALSDLGDNARSLTVGDYHPQRQRVLFNQSKNFMSPIEVINFYKVIRASVVI